MSDIFLNCCKRVHTANRLNDCYMLCTCVAPAFLSKWIEDLFSEITSADSNLLVGSRPKVKLPIPKASQSAYNRVQRISYGRIDTKKQQQQHSDRKHSYTKRTSAFWKIHWSSSDKRESVCLYVVVAYYKGANLQQATWEKRVSFTCASLIC